MTINTDIQLQVLADTVDTSIAGSISSADRGIGAVVTPRCSC